MKRHIGLIGCGNWGRHILRDLKTLGCEVSVVARGPKSQAYAAEREADRIVHSISELPHAIDGFVVATPTAIHAGSIESLLEFERPIFVEKPLTNDLTRARDLAQRAGEHIFVMDKWRYHPGVEALRDLARSGELGPVESIRTVRTGWGNPHTDVDGVWILLPHELSIVLEILGHIPDPVFASAEGRGSDLSGLVGIFGGSPRVLVEVSSSSAAFVRSVTVNCRDGSAVLGDGYATSIEIRRPAGPEPRMNDPQESRPISDELPLLRELGAFLEYLDGGPPPRSGIADAVRIVETIVKLRELALTSGLPAAAAASPDGARSPAR